MKKDNKSWTRIGEIGEAFVKFDLLKNYMNVYTPICDDDETDMIVESRKKPGKYYKLNVKHVLEKKTHTSLEVRFEKHTVRKIVDVIAVYYEPVGVAYLPFRHMGYPASINLALHTAVNNQESKRKFFYQFMRFPEFE